MNSPGLLPATTAHTNIREQFLRHIKKCFGMFDFIVAGPIKGTATVYLILPGLAFMTCTSSRGLHEARSYPHQLVQHGGLHHRIFGRRLEPLRRL